MQTLETAKNQGEAEAEALELPIELKDPNNDVVLIKLSSEPEPDEQISRLSLEKMPASAELSKAIGSIPQITSAIALNQSFRVVMPPGVVGKLMHLTTNPAMRGLPNTTIVGSGGRIVGSAGLASMSALAAPIVVWSILAFLTGQFFLTQIQRDIRSIFEELRKILHFLVSKEESELGARIEFLHYVSTNFSALSHHPEMRASTLTNLQKTKVESLAGLKLWTMTIERSLDDMKAASGNVKNNKDRKRNVGKVANLVKETRQHINRAIASWQCYALASTLEIQMGAIFDPSLLAYTKQSLSKQATDLKSALVRAEDIWNDCKSRHRFMESPQFETGKISGFSRDLTEFTASINRSIQASEKYIGAIEGLENRGMTLLYHNNAFYRPRQTVL